MSLGMTSSVLLASPHLGWRWGPDAQGWRTMFQPTSGSRNSGSSFPILIVGPHKWEPVRITQGGWSAEEEAEPWV